MHSKEDLESKKNDELRKIVKNLGLKGRRLKVSEFARDCTNTGYQDFHDK